MIINQNIPRNPIEDCTVKTLFHINSTNSLSFPKSCESILIHCIKAVKSHPEIPAFSHQLLLSFRA